MLGHIPPDLNVPTATKLLHQLHCLEGKVVEECQRVGKKGRIAYKPKLRETQPDGPEKNAALEVRRLKGLTQGDGQAMIETNADNLTMDSAAFDPESLISFNPFGFMPF